MKKSASSRKAQLVTIGVAIVAFAVHTVLSVVIFGFTGERDRLKGRNYTERTMSILLSSQRDHNDLGSAIEGIASLKAKVMCVGVHTNNGERIYAWSGRLKPSPAHCRKRKSTEGAGPQVHRKSEERLDRSFPSLPRGDPTLCSRAGRQ